MDINETSKKMKSRHPWELSRTKCVLKSMDSYLTDIHRNGEKKRYLNIGAGDMYFDRALMKKWKKGHFLRRVFHIYMHLWNMTKT